MRAGILRLLVLITAACDAPRVSDSVANLLECDPHMPVATLVRTAQGKQIFVSDCQQVVTRPASERDIARHLGAEG